MINFSKNALEEVLLMLKRKDGATPQKKLAKHLVNALNQNRKDRYEVPNLDDSDVYEEDTLERIEEKLDFLIEKVNQFEDKNKDQDQDQSFYNKIKLFFSKK